VGGVVLEKISKGVGIDKVVDGNDFESAFLIGSAESKTTNASESVDG
jgi:hypothetical protein